jgi:PKD repeat protein
MLTPQFPKMNRKNRRAQARRATKRIQPSFAGLESLEPRVLLSGTNLNELVDTNLSAVSLASALVGAGVEVSNVTYTGGSTSKASFSFNDPTVVGFGQGIILSSGNAADVVGPNLADSTSTDFMLPGDTDLDVLSGFTTFDAAVLEFDFVPTSNQVVFYYSFASDEYPEWVNTPYNDVFAFYVNGQNYAVVRQTAGDPNAAFVPVAVNNINNGNELYPEFVPARPDLFRPNYVTADGTPSLIDLELDGITDVLTFQAPVIPGVVNHMKLAIADASDGIYDSAVFIQAGSLVSNDNPIADLSISPSEGPAPLAVTAIIEGEDPNGAPLTYSINWGDGTPDTTGLLTNPTDDEEKTALESHTFASDGTYYVTLTVSNGSLSSTSIEDVTVGTGGGGRPGNRHPARESVCRRRRVVQLLCLGDGPTRA